MTQPPNEPEKSDAEITVHVEVATLILPLTTWATLTKGSLLQTGIPLGSPLSLRTEGKPAGLAELCVVNEGLAIRILQT